MQWSELQRRCIAQGKTLALAESCTGGAIAARITAVPGASRYFLGALITYADAWKERLLGVTRIAEKGAVSAEVVEEMLQGLLRLGADYALAVSGIAGPSGGSADKPIGTVFLGVGKKGSTTVERYRFVGDRASIIAQTADAALICLLQWVS